LKPITTDIYRNFDRRAVSSMMHGGDMAERAFVTHPFGPVFDRRSKILILGTMPSVRSRDAGFYYMHPRNRFWTVISALYGEPFPLEIKDREELLLKHGIALWDVLKSCFIEASSDSSIKEPVCNDISWLITNSSVGAVYANGREAAHLYRKFCFDDTGIEAVCLPSTSPANNRYHTYDTLMEEWARIL
jgi:hypoxanthine-DNA glycosylase